MDEPYTCLDCGKVIGEEEADRNLLAAWTFCDECMAKLMTQFAAGEASMAEECDDDIR